jgi:hypothetical protein
MNKSTCYVVGYEYLDTGMWGFDIVPNKPDYFEFEGTYQDCVAYVELHSY